ncbi:MAG: hypothetical protein JSR80_07745 [Verrucomicrobia bacterium]|nr:hypothetical protein [Verrucomicrobiota bacterium]
MSSFSGAIKGKCRPEIVTASARPSPTGKIIRSKGTPAPTRLARRKRAVHSVGRCMIS